MGAAASIECTKSVDASEIRSTNDLEISKAEIIRLRHLLGHLAKEAGFDAVVLDASDLVHGLNELEDHHRCCDEIAHIRSALRLGTQNSKRRTRVSEQITPAISIFNKKSFDEAFEGSSQSSSSSDDDRNDNVYHNHHDYDIKENNITEI